MSTHTLLCIAGGGTGGHVMPALALADAARQRWTGLDVEFVGAERGLEARLLPERGETVFLISMHSFQGASLIQKLRVLAWELPRAIWHIHRHWQTRRPRIVIGVGGYASVAGVVAAIMGRIPVVLYEQNAIPGMVNRRLATWCDRIMLGFSEAAAHLPAGKCSVTGNIVSPAISSTRWQPHNPPRLLVLGGSQGATALNRMVPEACHLLKQKGRIFAVSHVTGEGEDRVHAARAAYRQAGIKAEVIGFCRDMPSLYASGDLLIARAGAMTVTEAAAVGLPSLFIPLPHAADNHQYHNAMALAGCKAAEILEERHLSASVLASRIEALLFDRSCLEAMSRAARYAMPADATARQLGILANWLEGAA